MQFIPQKSTNYGRRLPSSVGWKRVVREIKMADLFLSITRGVRLLLGTCSLRCAKEAREGSCGQLLGGEVESGYKSEQNV